jgi:hypothetical protein
VNLILKKEFESWTSKRNELLQMVEDIRASLDRKGLLKHIAGKVIS